MEEFPRDEYPQGQWDDGDEDSLLGTGLTVCPPRKKLQKV